VFFVFHPDLGYWSTAVFARDCPWEVKTEPWVSVVFATFSMTYDCPGASNLNSLGGWPRIPIVIVPGSDL
jgi:hypothetical protein